MLETLLYTAGVTLPIFLMVLLGTVLKRVHFIDNQFIATSSKLVFNISMPALLFMSLSRLDLNSSLKPSLIFLSLGVTVISFVLAWVLAVMTVKRRELRGIFVQGAFRGNLAITGLAFANNMYGAEGVAQSSLLISLIIIFYNIFSIIVLEFYAVEEGKQSRLSSSTLIHSIIKNPLIISVAISLAISISRWTIPDLAYRVVEYLGGIALPLALLSIGGTINLQSMVKTSFESFGAAVFKLVVLPAAGVLIAGLLGYRGMELGILFVLFASPTAAASFVMAKAVTGQGTLAANIIAITTIGAIFTNSLGIFLLRYFSLI
ncbi:AEC family transporter [Parendozoicomonas sp. Alg238-R29]|uniref:AEC family transporter n=1 Tax=Parendozoicomonas sp. Alg238-R29 TaxID=2993446 RepID=UPI00248DA9BC|nr:AEC family transporter [Parendozoicomonas sp. Alg238-R29]